MAERNEFPTDVTSPGPMQQPSGQEETSTAKEVMPNESRNKLSMQSVPKLHQSEVAGDASAKTRAGDASGGGEPDRNKQLKQRMTIAAIAAEAVDKLGNSDGVTKLEAWCIGEVLRGAASVPPASQPASRRCASCGVEHGLHKIQDRSHVFVEPSGASQPAVMTAEQFWRGWEDKKWAKPSPEIVAPVCISFAEAYAREVQRGREAELATVVAELNSEILRGDNNFAEAEKYKFRAEAAEAQVRQSDALISKIQKTVAEFYGPGERWSDFDVLDGGVAGIAAQVRELKEALRELKDASNSLTGTIRNSRKNEQYLRLAKAVAGADLLLTREAK